ncbi:WD40 repeat domain-containing protein [Verrucomicrobiaceae bacterium 227]
MNKLSRGVGISVLVWALCGGSPVRGQEKEGPEVGVLIEQLGAKRVRLRDEAEGVLGRMPSAYDLLKQAVSSHKNPEVRLRAEGILEVLKESKFVRTAGMPNQNTQGALVTGFAISPDRKTLFTRCQSLIVMRDLEQMEVTGIIPNASPKLWGGWLDNAPVYFLACSPDGNSLAATDSRGGLYFYDLKNDNQLTKLRLPDSLAAERPLSSKSLLWHGRFFPESKKFATSSDGGLIDIWDLESGTLLETLPKVSSNRGLTFEISPDEKYLVAGFGQDQPFGEVFVWSFETSTWSGPHAGQMVTSVCFSKDGSKVLVTGGRGDCYLYALSGGELVREKVFPKLGKYAANALFSSDETSAFFGLESEEGEIVEVELATGEILWRSSPVGKTAERLAWLEGGRILALHSSGVVAIWQERGMENRAQD